MKYFVILLILFCGFVIFPVYAQNTTNFEPESQNKPIGQEDNLEKIIITVHGLYTDNKLQTQLLERGEEVQIVFAIKEAMMGETTKAVVRYQIVLTQDDPFDTTDTAEFRFDSLNSNEISFPFYPQEVGRFFLRQDISYQHDSGISPAGGHSLMPFDVVEKFNKATNEDGLCKKTNMASLFKPDFSTNVCVTPQTAMKLMDRWY